MSSQLYRKCHLYQAMYTLQLAFSLTSYSTTVNDRASLPQFFEHFLSSLIPLSFRLFSQVTDEVERLQSMLDIEVDGCACAGTIASNPRHSS